MIFSLFWWWCPYFHFLIHNLKSNSSPTLTYYNIFLFTNASFHFLIYNTRVTFNFFLHLFICNINITFSPTLTHYNIFLFTTACLNPLWYVSFKVFIGGVTCWSTFLDCFIHKTAFFWRRLRCTLLSFVSVFFSLFSFSISATLCLLDWSSLIVSIKRHFYVYITHPNDWTLVE